MKRFLILAVMPFLVCVVMFGQQEVTKFLNIPVDGSKSEMIRKLKAKGFRTDPDLADALIGEFNGIESCIYVVTNKNKVWRIMVSTLQLEGETAIKNRFNRLCRQFQNNKKYLCMLSTGYELSDEEDISYEMAVHDKHYEAVYYQLSAVIDTVAIMGTIKHTLLNSYTDNYTEEQLANPTLEIKNEIMSLWRSCLYGLSFKRQVWFTINKVYDQYCITMYYDNVCNQANGEDL